MALGTNNVHIGWIFWTFGVRDISLVLYEMTEECDLNRCRTTQVLQNLVMNLVITVCVEEGSFQGGVIFFYPGLKNPSLQSGSENLSIWKRHVTVRVRLSVSSTRNKLRGDHSKTVNEIALFRFVHVSVLHFRYQAKHPEFVLSCKDVLYLVGYCYNIVLLIATNCVLLKMSNCSSMRFLIRTHSILHQNKSHSVSLSRFEL